MTTTLQIHCECCNAPATATFEGDEFRGVACSQHGTVLMVPQHQVEAMRAVLREKALAAQLYEALSAVGNDVLSRYGALGGSARQLAHAACNAWLAANGMAAVEDQTTLAQPAPAVSASVGAEARLRMALTACNELSAMLPDGPHREHMATISGQVAMAMESIAALAQQPGAQGAAAGQAPDGWRQKAHDWLLWKAEQQDMNNARWPDHAAVYITWRDLPEYARWLAREVSMGEEGCWPSAESG
jgi:hypothetical protein